MNVAISRRTDSEVLVRYEIHLAGSNDSPPAEAYFDEAWRRAIADGFVDGTDRAPYLFHLHLPTTLYESSQ